MVDYREEQRFDWYWTGMFAVPALIIAWSLIWQVALGHYLLSGALLWPAFAVTLFVAFWFFRIKLITEVRDDCLYICFFRLWPERGIPWNEIRSLEAITYHPIRDFGGWGVRWAARGIVYHARGNRGVRMVLASGERVLVGSAHPDQLARSIAGRAGLPVSGTAS